MIYTFSDLKASINTRIHNKMGLIATPRVLINDVVTEVSGLKLHSNKKSAQLAPNLFNDIYQYAAPSDLSGNNIIGIQPQSMDRDRNQVWELTTEEEFDQRKQSEHNLIAVADHSFVRSLRISASLDSLREYSIASIQGLTGDSSTGASWAAFGNADTLATDTYNYIKGTGSLSFNLTSGGTTSGVVLTTANIFDLTSFVTGGSVFTWMYMTTASYATNVKLRLGSDSSNYYELTATTDSGGAAFVNGWNLIRFDFASKTTTGTPDDDACDYVALFVTKLSGSVDSSWRVNWLNTKQGSISNIIYYSGKPWISAAGTFLTKSTADTDYINCDEDEYTLFVEKGVEVLGMAAREYNDATLAATRYGNARLGTGLAGEYKRIHPTESLNLVSTIYNI
jgi:hypothetical protein